jgi:hypothetical protein
VIPLPLEPEETLLTQEPLETQAAAPEPQEPLAIQELQEAAPELQEIILALEIQEPQSPSQQQQSNISIMHSPPQQSPANLSLFHSPVQRQLLSAIRLNSTHLPDNSIQQPLLQVSAINSPPQQQQLPLQHPQELVLMELSSDDDVVFVAAVAAPVRPPRERRREERGRGRALRPRVVSTNDDDEFFVEKVVGWKVERGREYFSIKWAGYSEDFNTWEDGLEKRREIPEMVADYFTESGFDDEVSNFDDVNDRTYVNKRKRRRLM